MENVLIVGYVVEKQISIYDIDIEDGDFVGDIFKTTIAKCESTVKLLQYNNHINVQNINNFSICFLCSFCDTLFYKAYLFNRHLLCCEDRVKKNTPEVFQP